MSYPINEAEISDAGSSGSQFDIKKFIFKLVGFIPWIILSVIVCYTVAKLYLRYTPEIHKVSAYVLIKDDEENSSDYKVLRELGVMPGSREVQNQIDIFESFNMAMALVDSLNLDVQLVSKGRISSSAIYGKNAPVFIETTKTDTSYYKPATYLLHLYDDRFSIIENKETTYYRYNDTFRLNDHPFCFRRNKEIFADPDGYLLQFLNKRAVASGIRSSILVQKLHEMGGTIEIAISDRVPERAIDIINELIVIYNNAGLNDKNVVVHKTIRFLKERIDTVSSELDELELEASVYKSSNRLGDISAAGADYLQKSSRSDDERAEMKGKLTLLESLENYIKSSQQYTDIIPSTFGIPETTLSDLINQYNAAVLSLQNQVTISTEKDPTLGSLKTSISEIKANIFKNIASIRNQYEQQLNQIDNNYNKSETILASIPEKERSYLKMKRQIGVKEQLYLYLLQKKEETELSLASNINNTRIIDEAFDQGVILPKASQITTFGILLGILVPIVVMVLLDFFNNRIQDRREIETHTKVPILGELSYDRKRSGVIVNPKSRSVLAEQFRLLRTNFQYFGGEKSVQTILVTSFMSGEGKSFVSINLASHLSIGGAKVLLVEFDLRKPKLSKYLNIKPAYGLTDYLVNNHDYRDALTKMPGIETVDVLTSGPVPPNPTELLMSKKIEQLFIQAKLDYDFIVIDSSPIGLVADSFSLDKYSDVSLFILRHKYSFKTTLTYIDRLYVEKKFKNLAVIVNGIHEQGVSYGYGYGYGYSYGYGYGYGSANHYGTGYYEKEPKTFLTKVFSLFRL